MATKADKTTEFIIRKVAPIFNKHGYSGTSLSDLTKATGLTKGAIYGNFKNKEDLAITAFQFNIQNVVDQIKVKLSESQSPIGQLGKLTDFYRGYSSYTKANGGCPLVNLGVDANHDNMTLLAKVRQTISRLQSGIKKMIVAGIEVGEIKPTVDADKYSRYFFTMIEGGVFLMTTMDDDLFLIESMDRIDEIIAKELAV
jgi:AcrR family transcriptional regulator